MQPFTKLVLLFLIPLVLVLLLYPLYPYFLTFFQPEDIAQAELTPTRQFDLKEQDIEGNKLFLPEDLEIKVYAKDLGKVRFLAVHEGFLYASLPQEGKIIKIIDNNSDEKGDEVKVVADQLFYPHGLQFYEGKLYVAVQDGVVVLSELNETGEYTKKEQIIKDIPIGGNHITRTLLIHDSYIYLSVGSSCNLCIDEPKRAVVLRYNLDGSWEKVCAKGLRNSVGMIAVKDQVWATDNGADLLGDNFPPEEINIITCGKDYGWPSCHGRQTEDPDFGEGTCQETELPYITLQAHSAPLGLRVAENFPYEGLFVAYHGSWNRREPTGYKIVRIINYDTEPTVEDFITGWIDGKWGRPVDILFHDGKMFISDDGGGRIYL